MNKKRNGIATIKRSAGLLCAAAAWAAGAEHPVPSGPMADYAAHCTWGRLSAKGACADLADRLGAVEQPARDERLAHVWSQLETGALGTAEACSATEAIATEHPDYADALFLLSRCAVMGLRGVDDSVALLRSAAESDPDNYLVLRHLTEPFTDAAGIDPGTMAGYRESLYAVAKARVAWRRAVMPKAVVAAEPHRVWSELYNAAHGIYEAALREGDLDAAEALQVRFRRDAGLDDLAHGAEDPASLALACRYPIHLGLEEVCVAAIERVAERASADGLPLPPAVPQWVARMTEHLRREACTASMGKSRHRGLLLLPPGACEGPEATESAAVARLRAVLEHHGGRWSSEHHRVHAQGFLGDAARRDGLRAALRADPENVRARCDLARALRIEDPEAAADVLGENGDPSCIEYGQHVWGDTRQALL